MPEPPEKNQRVFLVHNGNRSLYVLGRKMVIESQNLRIPISSNRVYKFLTDPRRYLWVEGPEEGNVMRIIGWPDDGFMEI